MDVQFLSLMSHQTPYTTPGDGRGATGPKHGSAGFRGVGGEPLDT
jgi:hypothetical protein